MKLIAKKEDLEAKLVSTKGLRKAFTMVELIFVIVIMAVLIAVIAALYFSFFTKNDMKAAITNDAQAISIGLIEYKTSSPYATPAGSYGGIGATYVARAVSEKMDIVDADNNLGTSQPTLDYLKSLGVNGDCKYFIAAATSATGTNDRAAKVLMDCSDAIVNKGWTNRDAIQAEDVFAEAWRKRSIATPTIVSLATAIGAANVAPTGGGEIDDGIIAVTGIVN